MILLLLAGHVQMWNFAMIIGQLSPEVWEWVSSLLQHRNRQLGREVKVASLEWLLGVTTEDFLYLSELIYAL